MGGIPLERRTKLKQAVRISPTNITLTLFTHTVMWPRNEYKSKSLINFLKLQSLEGKG